MKIGPNHEPGPLPRQDQESAKRTQGKTENGDQMAGAKGNPKLDSTQQPKDTLHLSAHSPSSIERVGYDSQELRDRLIAARSLSEETPIDVDSSGEIDSAKLDIIRQFIESGFYDRDEVTQQIADKLADEFIGAYPEQGDRQ